MRAVIAVALVLAGTTAHAQSCTIAQAAEDPSACSSIQLSLQPHNTFAQAQDLSDKRSAGVIMRNTGIALTLLGTALTIAGSVVGTSSALSDSGSEAGLSAGIAMLTVGQLMPVVGIPLWVHGQIKVSHAERAMLTLTNGGAKVTF